MENDWELIIARLEILEIEVCNILQNPRDIGKRVFLEKSKKIENKSFQYFPDMGNIEKSIFQYFQD